MLRSFHRLISCKQGGEVWYLLLRRADAEDSYYEEPDKYIPVSEFSAGIFFFFSVFTNWKLDI